MATVDANGKVLSEVSFYKRSKIKDELLGLTGGIGNIASFLCMHHRFLKFSSRSSLKRKVIVFIDNDRGISDIKKKIRDEYSVELSINDGKSAYKLHEKLTIVKTPEIPGLSETCSEDFLPKAILNRKIGNRTFSREDNFDSSRFYGKVELGRQVANSPSNVRYKELRRILFSISDALLKMN